MTEMRELLHRTADLAADFLDSVDTRPVVPQTSADELFERLGGPVPDEPTDPETVIAELAAAADPGLVAIPSGRYFGFVNGGELPAALAADWLTAAWDQNAGLYASGPSAAVIEEVVRGWVVDLLGLPAQSSLGLATGTQMGSVTALAAARYRVLQRAGWDVAREGLGGGPRVRVLVGAQRHATIDRALRLLGLGSPEVVDADRHGRMLPAALANALDSAELPTIVCAQAGEVNTGSFDPFDGIASACTERGAWLHVDGAFGLWAAASTALRPLTRGVERANSWITDAHKWLNVPYDAALVLCADPEAHAASMSMSAAYLMPDHDVLREGYAWVTEASRRARGFTVYAALRSLGRKGLSDVLERTCACARAFAEGLGEIEGAEVLNEVVLNQVLFRFESDERTDEILRAVQASGDVWLGGTSWDGRRAIRLSVSNWRTGDEEIRLALEAFKTAVQEPARAPAR
jgi:glutamate/tyrosine decarboxylase-like PLP-dependent enzyme